MAATLKECLDRHGSDKAWRHHYHLIYEPAFAPLRENPLALLEVGVWRGGSVRAWREWFPNASITGLDIFKRKPMQPIDGVTQVVADSTTPPDDLGTFDIIIDDGCHYPLVQARTLKAMWPKLNAGGTYFLEDVWKPDPNHPWTKEHSDQYQAQNFDQLHQEIQDTGGEFEVHDQRKLSGELDSCIYVVRKP